MIGVRIAALGLVLALLSLLQELGTALAQANGYLIKSCPAEIPPLPVERLQLMDRRSTR